MNCAYCDDPALIQHSDGTKTCGLHQWGHDKLMSALVKYREAKSQFRVEDAKSAAVRVAHHYSLLRPE